MTKMTDLIKFLDNNGKSDVYTGGSIHIIYHYLEMIGSTATLTPSGQHSHNLGSSSYTKNETDGFPQERRRIGNPQRGENIVPHKLTIRVNPNRGKQRGITERESPGIANSKGNPSGRQMELVPMCPRENSNKDPGWHQKEIIPRHQRKQRGIPKKEYLGIFTPKYDPSWHQKDINSEVPEG